MTCIVGVADGKKVSLGADSCGSDGWLAVTRRDSKLFRKDEFLIGFTTSFRMGQLLEYATTLPKPPNDSESLFGFMCTQFVDSIRSSLKLGGWSEKEKDKESGGTFLVGIRGRLFRVDSDYQVMESSFGFDAVGKGAQVAMGALHATKGEVTSARLQKALEASEALCESVRPPFLFLED